VPQFGCFPFAVDAAASKVRPYGALPSKSVRKRGRPRKFNRPSQVVALTLPNRTLRHLKRIHPDPAWAIVTLVEKRAPDEDDAAREHADLVAVAERRFLIAVNRTVVRKLPGVHIIPLDGHRAFLALDPGHGMADLELAVLDRLENGAVNGRERHALVDLRTRLAKWRRDRSLRVNTRAIIVLEKSR
jgi:hypothetical protein